jgi:hypothetical protein
MCVARSSTTCSRKTHRCCQLAAVVAAGPLMPHYRRAAVPQIPDFSRAGGRGSARRPGCSHSKNRYCYYRDGPWRAPRCSLPTKQHSCVPTGTVSKVGFVDEPRHAVEQADELVASTVKRLAQIFADERTKLEQQWSRGDRVSTEDLRLALQRYRSFFSRLLSV